MLELKPIKHDHKGTLWCGLAALSTITGYGTKHCKKASKFISEDVLEWNSRRMMGMYMKELTTTLTHFGYNCSPVYRLTGREYEFTLRNFLDQLKPTYGVLYLILIEGHFVVADAEGLIVDTLTKDGCHYKHHPKKHTPVIDVYEVREILISDL
jgi:hypothetical protein